MVFNVAVCFTPQQSLFTVPFVQGCRDQTAAGEGTPVIPRSCRSLWYAPVSCVLPLCWGATDTGTTGGGNANTLHYS